MSRPAITVTNLAKKAGQRYLLRDLSWRVESGEHWCILGMNGSGKTTLLSILAGYQLPSDGNVQILGQSYDSGHIFAQRKRVGFVSSSYFGKIFSRESLLNIVLSGLCGGINVDGQITLAHLRQAKALLTRFHLRERIDQPFCQLSKGEQQNVLIARALLAEPDILLLDELTSGLDVLARSQILATLHAIMTQTGATIIYVTHYPEEITSDFDQCLLLRDGRIYQSGSCAQILQQETLADFLQCSLMLENLPDGARRLTITAPPDAAIKGGAN